MMILGMFYLGGDLVTIQQIMYALTVEECHSMNKASEKLFITQPTLTNAIKELEQEIGVHIFLRTHKGVIPTAEGKDFLLNSRRIYKQFELLQAKYAVNNTFKRKFGVSTKHCSFAIKAFVETAKHYDMADFEFAVRETSTMNVIKDVSSLRSEVGILYVNSSNKRIISKLLIENELDFNCLARCRAHVYMWKNHPLADKKKISLDQLTHYPYLVFEQGNEMPLYFAEEFLTERIFPKIIKGTDRGTMHNLMVGLNGFSIGSGLISEEVNGGDYVVIPLDPISDTSNNFIEIGYISKKYNVLSDIGECYIKEINSFLEKADYTQKQSADRAG